MKNIQSYCGNFPKYKNWLDTSDYILKLAEKLAKIYKKRKARYKDEFEFITLFFFVKSFFTFRAVNILAKEKLGPDAAMLMRTLLENVAYLSYISEKPKKYSKDYLLYEIKEKKILKDILEKDAEWFKRTEKVLREKGEEVLNYYEKLKGKYPGYQWSGKSITELIKHIPGKDKTTYGLIYSRLSALSHSYPSIIRCYIKDIPGGIITDIQQNEGYLYETLPTISILFFMILDKFNNVFKLKQDKKIKAAEKKLKKTHSQEKLTTER